MAVYQKNNNRNYLVQKVFLALLLSFHVLEGWSQSDNKMNVQQNSDKSGYTSGLEQGIASLTSFLALQDDAKAESFLRFSKLDSLTTSWFDWKRKVNENIGLQFNVSYATTNQYGQNSPQNLSKFAAGGEFKVYSRWNLINRRKKNTGTLVVGLAHRHAYTDIPPSELGGYLGYHGQTALLFNNMKLNLLELSWQQKFNKGRTGIVIGRYDPNDYFDVLGYVNPFTTFQNLSITVNPSIAFPDSSTGLGVGHWINDQFLIQATVNDANGIAPEVVFFHDWSELYTSAELSWSPSRKDRFFKNFHITHWHADERMKAGIEEGSGIVIGGNWTFHETFMPFFKAGWSQGSASIYSQSYTGGFIIRPNVNKDLIGFGLNWGETQNNIGQLSTELFYRFQFSQNFAITPNVQYFSNPALDPSLDSAFIVGLRGRIAM